MTMQTIPQPLDDDCDDVVLALQVAGVRWRNGDQQEAVKWLRRAADAAFDAEQDRRGIELSKLAADLATHGRKEQPPSPSRAVGSRYTTQVVTENTPVSQPRMHALRRKPPGTSAGITPAPPFVQQPTPPLPPAFSRPQQPPPPPVNLPAPQPHTLQRLEAATTPAPLRSRRRTIAERRSAPRTPPETAVDRTADRPLDRQPLDRQSEPIALVRKKPLKQKPPGPMAFQELDDEPTSVMAVGDVLSLHRENYGENKGEDLARAQLDNQWEEKTLVKTASQFPLAPQKPQEHQTPQTPQASQTPEPSAQPSCQTASEPEPTPPAVERHRPSPSTPPPPMVSRTPTLMPFARSPSVTNEVRIPMYGYAAPPARQSEPRSPRIADSAPSYVSEDPANVASTSALRVAVGTSDTGVYVRPLGIEGLRPGEYEAVLVQLSETGDIQQLFR